MGEQEQGGRRIFGPVASRRLGLSLGVDPIPYKTCSYNCIYCQLGPTTTLTTRREAYIPAREVLADLERWLGQGGGADYITLSGSGEPTLSSELGEIIAWLKLRTATPVAVLTNGSLLWRDDVLADLVYADLIIPSLDAAREEPFAAINRPAAEITLGQVVEGLARARRELPAEMWLEIMLVSGVNDGPEDLAALREAIAQIAPHRVQLNTPVRPPAEKAARPLSAEELARAAAELGGDVEVIARRTGSPVPRRAQELAARVLELVERRPCTPAELELGLGAHPNELAKVLQELVEQGRISTTEQGGEVFFCARH